VENRFHRDLRLLMGIGAATAALIAGVGYLALRGLRWEENSGVIRELVLYAGIGLVLLGIVSWWVWRTARRLKRPHAPER
jgi:membrane protein DedA with SNARE-associated domain